MDNMFLKHAEIQNSILSKVVEIFTIEIIEFTGEYRECKVDRLLHYILIWITRLACSLPVRLDF